MILVASCLIPARRSVDSDASLGEKTQQDTNADMRGAGNSAVVGVSCYLESGRRKREKEQDHHRFFGDLAFHQGLMFRLGVAAFHLQSL
ncbi:unnamed protein product [Sphagnum balticum]